MRIRILLFVFICLVLSGCNSRFGSINHQPAGSAGISIQDLAGDWENYLVYYGTRDGNRPAALIFDPKTNNTTLRGDAWTKVKSSREFSEILRQVQNTRYTLRVAQIRGPGEKLFGYIYYRSGLHVPVKVVDANTLYVMSLPNLRIDR